MRNSYSLKRIVKPTYVGVAVLGLLLAACGSSSNASSSSSASTSGSTATKAPTGEALLTYKGLMQPQS